MLVFMLCPFNTNENNDSQLCKLALDQLMLIVNNKELVVIKHLKMIKDVWITSRKGEGTR